MPHKVVIGQKEIDSGFIDLEVLVGKLGSDVRHMPFISREWPAELSRQL